MWSDRKDKVTRPCSLGGYLWKMKRKYNVHLPQWNKRWFSVEGKYLRWYRKEDSIEISGEILLSKIKSINRFESGRGVYSFIIYCEERNLFLRADSLKNMEKWSRAIEMQADYARGGDGTSMLSNPNQATEPKKRIRQNHSLLSELDRATKALEFLEKEAHHCDAAGTDSLESSVGTDSNEVQVSLSDQPQSGPQTATNSDRVQKISSRAADPRLDESFESVDIVEPVVVRVRAGKSSKAAPRHFQPTHAPVRRQLDDNYSGDDVYSGERSKASSMCIRGPSPKDNGKEEPIRTGWM